MRARLFRAGVPALLLALIAACGDSATSQPPSEATRAETTPASRLVVAVVDFSGSQTSHATRDARAHLERVVQQLEFGDRFVLLEMYRTGARDSVGRFVQDMPNPRRSDAITSYDTRELEAAKRGVLNALPVFFDPRFVGSVATTDILTTLHIASEYLRDADTRRAELLLLSDMLQSTPDGFEFEGVRRMPAQGWVNTQQSGGLLPDLEEACVVVIGADPTTASGQRVRSFWTAYFDAAGARLDPNDYRVRPPVDAAGCE